MVRYILVMTLFVNFLNKITIIKVQYDMLYHNQNGAIYFIEYVLLNIVTLTAIRNRVEFTL